MEIRILGAGYGGMRAALDLDRLLGYRKDVKITLIDKHAYHQFRTELHKAAAGTTEERDVRIPIKDILGTTKRVRFMKHAVDNIDVAAKQVTLSAGPKLSFDKLVVSMGGSPAFFNIPGMEENALTIRGVNSARIIKEHIEAMLETAGNKQDEEGSEDFFTIVVGGGGLTGVEFITEVLDRVPRLARKLKFDPRRVRLIMIEAAPQILLGFDDRLVKTAKTTLEDKGIEVILGDKIVDVAKDHIRLDSDRVIPCRTFVWAGGIRGNSVVDESLTTQARGRAVVNRYLQSVDSPDVYVIGDCALPISPKTGNPVAPTAQNAVHQGRVVARNIYNDYWGRDLTPYDAKTFGMVASLGRGFGLAELSRLNITGMAAAVLKDLVTLRYIYSLGGTRLLFRRMAHA